MSAADTDALLARLQSEASFREFCDRDRSIQHLLLQLLTETRVMRGLLEDLAVRRLESEAQAPSEHPRPAAAQPSAAAEPTRVPSAERGQ